MSPNRNAQGSVAEFSFRAKGGASVSPTHCTRLKEGTVPKSFHEASTWHPNWAGDTQQKGHCRTATSVGLTILNETLVNQINCVLKTSFFMSKLASLHMQALLNICKSVSLIPTYNRLKNRNHMIFSTDAEGLWQIQHLFMKKKEESREDYISAQQRPCMEDDNQYYTKWGNQYYTKYFLWNWEWGECPLSLLTYQCLTSQSARSLEWECLYEAHHYMRQRARCSFPTLEHLWLGPTSPACLSGPHCLLDATGVCLLG